MALTSLCWCTQKVLAEGACTERKREMQDQKDSARARDRRRHGVRLPRRRDRRCTSRRRRTPQSRSRVRTGGTRTGASLTRTGGTGPGAVAEAGGTREAKHPAAVAEAGGTRGANHLAAVAETGGHLATVKERGEKLRPLATVSETSE